MGDRGREEKNFGSPGTLYVTGKFCCVASAPFAMSYFLLELSVPSFSSQAQQHISMGSGNECIDSVDTKLTGSLNLRVGNDVKGHVTSVIWEVFCLWLSAPISAGLAVMEIKVGGENKVRGEHSRESLGGDLEARESSWNQAHWFGDKAIFPACPEECDFLGDGFQGILMLFLETCGLSR